MSEKPNAAGLIVSGDKNPNWKGGKIEKVCSVCGRQYQVKRANSSSRFCSLQCVGISQRGKTVNRELKRVLKICCVCGSSFSVFLSHEKRHKCCSKQCSNIMRSSLMKGKEIQTGLVDYRDCRIRGISEKRARGLLSEMVLLVRTHVVMEQTKG